MTHHEPNAVNAASGHSNEGVSRVIVVLLRRPLTILKLFPLACAVVLPGFAQNGSAPVHVVIPGDSWSSGGKAISSERQSFPPNAEITGIVVNSSDLVVECENKVWIAYTCKKLPCRVMACSENVPKDNLDAKRVSPVIRGESSSSESSGGLFSSLFKRQPATLAVLGVREGGHPNDALVRQTGTELHLGPGLNRVLEGKYCFRFTPLPSGSAAPQTAVMDWDRSTDSEGILQAPNLKPGLYTIEKSPSEAAGACTFEQEKTPAWILIASEADFTRLQPDWKDYTNQMHDIERSGASPTVLLTVRHALLARLADSTQTK